jgi:DNA-binding LacI/PurR family transcriptional regulator
MNIQELAKRAKVFTATVSRTINRKPTVDPHVAELVWRVIEKSGYRPNVQARAICLASAYDGSHVAIRTGPHRVSLIR